MDCTQAQAAISEALDGEALDRALLEDAKRHCRECPDCAAFVRGLNAVKRAALPQPDPALVDRVMTAVRREAARAAAAPAPAGGAPDTTADSVSPAAAARAGTPSGSVASVSRAIASMRRPVLVAWIAAAAVLVVSAGVIGVLGVRLMSPGQTADTATLADGVRESSGVQAPVEGGLVPPPPAASTTPSEKASSATAVPSYITLNGTAYRLGGVSTTTKAELTRIGSTTSSLDGGEQRLRDVLQRPGQPGVYVENDKAQILEFVLVERQYQGRSYRLQSAALVAFGTWPILPSTIPQPTAADGSPVFTQVSTDGSGVPIYQLVSSETTQGIAVQPGSPESDPAGGNPGWTWWAPSP